MLSVGRIIKQKQVLSLVTCPQCAAPAVGWLLLPSHRNAFDVCGWDAFRSIELNPSVCSLESGFNSLARGTPVLLSTWMLRF